MAERRHRRHRLVDRIGNPIHRHPPLPTRHPRVGAERQQRRARRRGDPVREFQRRRVERVGAEEQHRRLAPAQHRGGGGDRVRVGQRACGHRQGLGDHAAFGPGGVGGQDQGRDLPGRGARRLDRHRRIAPDRRGRACRAHEPRHAARPALRIRGQRGIERAVVGRLIAHDVDDRARRPPRIVQVGERVREARAAMEQGGRRLARHARIAVGGTGNHALEQAEHAAHAGNAVERGDEMHLRRAGIGKAGVDAAGQQGGDEGFGAVHAQCSGSRERTATLREASGGGNRGPGPPHLRPGLRMRRRLGKVPGAPRAITKGEPSHHDLHRALSGKTVRR